MGAQGGQAASTFVERERVLWKIGAKRSFPAALSTPSQHSRASSVRRSP